MGGGQNVELSQLHVQCPHLSLPELLQIQLERLHVVLEAQCCDGPQQVVAVDGFALLALALVAGPAAAKPEYRGYTVSY
jgi:hypothetical protein